jgi:hypothetical protein
MSFNDNIENLRAKYEEFLNNFDTFPISYNFLPNEIFQQIGKGLNVQMELNDFHNRIIRMSETIKEKKQERMNLLLGLISVMSALATTAVIPAIIKQSNEVSGISALIYFTFLAFVLIILSYTLLRFLKPVKRLKFIFKIIFRRKYH